MCTDTEMGKGTAIGHQPERHVSMFGFTSPNADLSPQGDCRALNAGTIVTKSIGAQHGS